MSKALQVTCAIIEYNQKIVVVQRSSTMSLPGKWEFPGGKREAGESEEACIVREIREELNIEIEVGRRLPSVVHRYPDLSIELIPFMAICRSGEIQLAEHEQYCLLAKNELTRLDWAAADLPIVKMLLK